MKITDRFVGDHKTFRKLMTELDGLPETASTEAERRRLVRLAELFVDHLVLHAWGEEVFYYPRVAGKLADQSSFSLARLDAEHDEIDGLAAEFEAKARAAAADWKPVYARFKAALLAHMALEEDRLFPESERVMGAPYLEELSVELEKRRREAPAIRRHQAL